MLSHEVQSQIEATGFIRADAVSEYLGSGIPLDELMLELIPFAQKFAIPPISNFYVGAIAHGVSGALYAGANYEFPGEALSFSVHGEQAAVANAMAHGETGIDLLAVSAAPCGYCRQFLNELTTATTLQVILEGSPATLLIQLLPASFGPRDLGVAAALMATQSHSMTLENASDALANAALRAANASYAPYSASYAGVALQTSDGGMFSGGVAENAAFNPSMSPLEAAIVDLVIRGRKSYTDIVDAVLVEAAGSKASQAGATIAILRTITTVPLRVFIARSTAA